MQDSEGEQDDSSDAECKYICLIIFFENMSVFVSRQILYMSYNYYQRQKYNVSSQKLSQLSQNNDIIMITEIIFGY